MTTITSLNIASYGLSKSHMALFTKFDAMRDYMERAGRKPAHVLISDADYADIDKKVRSASGGKRQLSDLYWKGFPITSESRVTA